MNLGVVVQAEFEQPWYGVDVRCLEGRSADQFANRRIRVKQPSGQFEVGGREAPPG